MRQHALRLPDDLMQALDSTRGRVPRNAYLTDMIREWLQAEDPTPEVQRSPEVQIARHVPGEPKAEYDEFVRAAQAGELSPKPDSREARQALSGHKADCRCLNCEGLSGK